MLYPQNGDRIVAIDYVTSLHPMYIGYGITLPGVSDERLVGLRADEVGA